MKHEHYEQVKKQLIRDEGLRRKGYLCPAGYWTIGIGHNVETGPALSLTAVDAIFEGDYRSVAEELAQALPWALGLSPARHAVLVNMCFNLGLVGLLRFRKMLAYLRAGEWEKAAIECADPNYVSQVGERALRLAEQLRTGEWK